MIEMALSRKARKIEKAYEELEYLSQDEKAREEFDAYQKAIMDENSKIHYAEKNKAIEIAKEMLKSKMPKTEIIKYTKLSEEELNKIENEEY